MSQMHRRKCAALTCVAPAVLVLFSTIAAGNDKDEVVEAVWKQQQLSFAYRGGDTVHTCTGLRSRLRSLLILLGAHESVAVSVQRCDDAGDMRAVSITIASPFEAGETEPHQDDATAELVARLRGEDRAGANEAPFPAHWKTISFANMLSLRLTAADCELLKELRLQVMPKLAVRVVSDRLRCSSDLHSGSRPQLVVAALVMAEPARRAF